MSKIKSQLTVFFEEPFWVGVAVVRRISEYLTNNCRRAEKLFSKTIDKQADMW